MQQTKTVSDILDFYAQTNTAYLHARGAQATRLLAGVLNGQRGEKILEFGFGTGSTTVHMAAAFPQTDFYGVDVSQRMFRKAQARLRFCGLEKRCRLFLVQPREKLPFEDRFFDKIFVESVLAMQPGEQLGFAVGEIARLLKPGGQLVMNETLWLETASQADIDRFNRLCEEKFGVIQANGRYPYIGDWIELLQKHGLRVDTWRSLDDPDTETGVAPGGWAPRLSALFTFLGRLKVRLWPRFRKIQAGYEREESVFYAGKKFLAGMLIVATRG